MSDAKIGKATDEVTIASGILKTQEEYRLWHEDECEAP
jgi:hypothetical protein